MPQGRGVPVNLSDDESGDDQEQDAYITRLLQAAAAGQIDIEWMLQEAQDQIEGPPDYSFDKLPTNLKEVADFILSNRCRKILIL